MYFGVDDDHEVCGLKESKKLLEDIPNKVSTTWDWSLTLTFMNRMVLITLNWLLNRAMSPSAIRVSIITVVVAPCRNLMAYPYSSFC